MSIAVESGHALDGLFNPKAIALVGATERSHWSNVAYANLKRFGYRGAVHLVNRNGGLIYGQTAATNCVALGSPVDTALLMVPGGALLATLDDLHDARIANAVILSSGFAEMGAEGRELQSRLVLAARERNIRLLGPNCLGFINYRDQIPLWTSQRRAQRTTGSVAIASQSGAVANVIADAAFNQSLLLTFLISTGNEADIDIAATVDYLADDADTRVIGLFVETIRDSERFAAAALKAARANKPIVVMKVGASEQSSKAAQAHTGAVVGDDGVFNAACLRYNMIRVNSPDGLVTTCAMLADLAPVAGGLGIIAMSGGMCEVAADRAADLGIQVPELAPATLAALKATLPEYATPHNPLDVTGAVMLKPEILEQASRILAADPQVGVVACLLDAITVEDPTGLSQAIFGAFGRGVADSGKSAYVQSNVSAQVTRAGHELINGAAVHYVGCGLEPGLGAVAGAMRWWEGRNRVDRDGRTNRSLAPPVGRLQGEREVLDYLSSVGVPVIPNELARSSADAERLAAGCGGNVSLKIASPQIAHKSDVGGVRLNISVEAAAQAYGAMVERVGQACPGATIDGVLVSPMRSGGVELFVGVMRDAVWGPVIAVGLGGVFVEVLKDTTVRLLPVGAEDVLEMFEDLKAKAILKGFRGGPAVDLHAAAQAVVMIGAAALAAGPDLVALEVNPLLATGSIIEALDGLMVWSD